MIGILDYTILESAHLSLMKEEASLTQEIEIESKNLLTKNEYNKLLKFFNVKSTDSNQQVNHYFETRDYKLKQNGSALRIRNKQQQWQLTLKQPHQDGLLETHDFLTSEVAQQWIKGYPINSTPIEKQLKAFGVTLSELEYGGILTTNRIEVPYHDALVVLDHSQYNGQVDYELEVEAKQRITSEKVMAELIQKLSIEVKFTPNKIERFYHSLSQ